jgi:hypothetical protein
VSATVRREHLVSKITKGHTNVDAVVEQDANSH